jgi:hypothetical protein
LNRYGDTTEAIIKDEVNRAEELAKLRPVEAETEIKSLVNDTDKAFKEMHDNINKVMDGLSNEIRETAMQIAAAQNIIAKGRDELTRAMDEVAARQALERIPEFREYQEDLDRLLGGPLPGAITQITPAQTREGRMFGMDLQNLRTTRAEIERFDLLRQLRDAEGEQAQRLRLQLRDLPEAHRREREVYKQRQEDARLRAQLQPYEALALDIQRLRQVRTIPDQAQQALEEYQKAVVGMLARATERVSKERLDEEVRAALKAGKITEREAESELKRISAGGPTQYRGTLITGVANIEKLRVAAQERFAEVAPTRQIIEMREANKPVVNELKHQSDLLEVIAKEGLDISEKKLPEAQVPTATSLESLNKDLSFFEKVWNPRRILRMLDPRTHFAPGGKVFGEGGPREDKVPAMLSPGEYVIRAAAAKRLGYDKLEYMNEEGELPFFRGGGMLRKKRRMMFQQGGQVADFDLAIAADILKQLGVDAYVAYTSTGKIPPGYKPSTPATTPTITPTTPEQQNVLQKFKAREKVELDILRKAFPNIETDPALKAMRDFYLKNKKADGGFAGWLKERLYTIPVEYWSNFFSPQAEMTEEDAIQVLSKAGSYLGQKDRAKAYDIASDISGKKFAEGGFVNWLKKHIYTIPIEYWSNFFSPRAGVMTEEDAVDVLSKAGSYFTASDRKKAYDIATDYQAGGKVRRFVATAKGEIYQVDEEGNIIGVLPGTSRTPKFAEQTATETGRGFGSQATQLHRLRQRVRPQAEEAAFQRQRARGIAEDVNVRRMLRKPGIDQEPGDEAIRSAYGLNVLEFDRQRGTVSFEGIPGGRVSYHDLREIEFQDLSRAMASGQIPTPSIMGRVRAAATGMAPTPGEDPGVKAQLEARQVQKEALRYRLLTAQRGEIDVKPGGRLFREAEIHYGRETALLLPIYHALKSAVEAGGVSMEVLRNYDLAEKLLLGTSQLTTAEKEKAIGSLVRYHKFHPELSIPPLKKRDGGSLSVFHQGGVVSQTGPILAQRGEMIVPRALADGGLVDNEVATATLKGGTIRIEESGIADKIANKIKEVLESTEVKVDEDAKVAVDVGDATVPVEVGEESVSVDTTGISIPVEVGTVVVPVDAAGAGEIIGKAVGTAISQATVDVNVNTTGAAVGAEAKIDALTELTNTVRDELITVKDDLETQIVDVRNDITTTVGTEVESRVNAAITRVQQDVNEQRTQLSLAQSKISRVEHNTNYRILEAERLSKESLNFATRPPEPTVG